MEQHDSPDVYYATVEEQFLAREDVDLRRSLNGAGLAYDGRIFAFLDTDDALVVHIGATAVTAAVSAGDGERYALGSRAMRAWLKIEFDESDVARWERYIEQAYDTARGISNS